MAPFVLAPATLGLKIVLVTTAIIAFFVLSVFGLYRLRTSLASRRPVDVEAAVAKIETQSVPHLTLRHTHSRLNCVRAGVDSNARSESMLPDSTSFQESSKTLQQEDCSLVASSSFEGWTSSLCDLIEDFAGGERTRESGLVVSSSFEVWAANLCELISDFASPVPIRSGFTPLTDNFEDDPYILESSTMYEPTADNIPDIIVTAPSLPQIAEDTHHESFEPALVTSPSFMDLAAECLPEVDTNDTEATVIAEDSVEATDDIPVAPATELLDAATEYTQKEPTLSLSLRHCSILSNEEHDSDYTTYHDHSQYLSPTSALSLPPVAEEPIVECEPEETLKSVFESDSEDDETYYSRRPHLSRPKQASPSMSSMLRAIVEKRKVQQNQRKESKSKNDKENTMPSKRRVFSKALATPSEPRNPIKVPTIRFTPPTPPRRGLNRKKEDVGLDLDTDMDEVVERVAFDVVFDDNGRFFF